LCTRGSPLAPTETSAIWASPRGKLGHRLEHTGVARTLGDQLQTAFDGILAQEL
jgi:hypothetical protein